MERWIVSISNSEQEDAEKMEGKRKEKKPQGASKRANLRIVDVATREDSRDLLPYRLIIYVDLE